MCGIAAIVGAGREAWLAERIRTMTNALEHRGPNAEGHYVDARAGVAFGHRRLSIIDLSESANQPMFSNDGNLIMIANCEIYNFRELRKELQSAGHHFRSDSDSEVILYAYKQWGEGCVEHLFGMFAFLVYDKSNGIIFGARDRIGEKPLNIFSMGDRLYMASETKAFKALEGWNAPRIDPVGVFAHFSTSGITAPFSIYADVIKIGPAECFSIKLGGKLSLEAVRRRTYWYPRFDKKLSRTDTDWIAEGDALFRTIVDQEMVSDVPIGILLSGGVDSSLLAAYAQKEGQHTNSLCIGRPIDQASQEDPEFIRARLVAAEFKTNHREVIYDEPGQDLLSRVVACVDEPFSRSDGLFMHELWGVMSDSVTVAVGGNGADEAFCGYWPVDTQIHSKKRAALARLLGYIKAFGMLPEQNIRLSRLAAFGQGNWSELAWDNFSTFYQYGANAKQLHANSNLNLVDVKQQVRARIDDVIRETRPRDSVDLISVMQLYFTNVFGTVMSADASAMAFSLEVRNPFLDHRLMEWAASMPSRVRLKPSAGGAIPKWPLKKLLEKFLPEQFVNRRKIPIGGNIDSLGWVRRSYTSKLDDLVDAGRLQSVGLFDNDELLRNVSNYRTGTSNDHQFLFSLLTFDEWLRQNDGAYV